jgi:hypothetical protein
MNDDEIELIAKHIPPRDSLLLANQLVALVRAAREAAIEECAEACEQHQGSAEMCASAIRALREGKS